MPRCPLSYETDLIRGFSMSKKILLYVVSLCFIFIALLIAKEKLGSVDFAIPSFEKVKATYAKSDAVLIDRHGEVIHELRVTSKGRRLDWINLSEVSPALRTAVIASEDKRFYQHRGIDWKALSSVVLKNLFTKNPRGASTITMQLVPILDKRLASKSAVKTLSQKWNQIKTARELEKRWTKDQIPEAYLNLITFRGELQGLSAASRGLFDKEPNGLNINESLLLACLIRSPNTSIEQASDRACLLGRAANLETNCDSIRALAQKSLAVPYYIRPHISLAPHLAHVLLDAGKTKVITTLDKDLQQFAFESLRHHLMAVRSQNVHDGAILIVRNETGDVLAYVGSTGEGSSARFMDGVQARRQAGSSLKPFLYALAFDERILTPASILEDSPLDVPTERGIYRPENYEKEFKGMVTARTALASSLNIPAIRTLSLVGVEPFTQKLDLLGFGQLRSDDFYGYSLALGSADISLWQLVNAYRTLANKGARSELRLTFEQGKGLEHRVFSEEAAFLVSNILSDREARSVTFSLENPLSTRFWSAVKTGTSKDMRDNWCVGYTSQYTMGVWVGNFSGASMWNVSGIVGAAPVWLEVMNYLHAKDPWKATGSQKPPAGIVAKTISFDPAVASSRKEWFISGTEPDAIKQAGSTPAPKILYPAQGTIIALDPDIPEDQQRIFFEAAAKSDTLIWVLNERILGPTSEMTSWKPESGVFKISLIDKMNENKIIDAVNFTVRGH